MKAIAENPVAAAEAAKQPPEEDDEKDEIDDDIIITHLWAQGIPVLKRTSAFAINILGTKPRAMSSRI